MKKLIIILIAALFFISAPAQSRKDGYGKQDRNQVSQTPGQDISENMRSVNKGR